MPHWMLHYRAISPKCIAYPCSTSLYGATYGGTKSIHAWHSARGTLPPWHPAYGLECSHNPGGCKKSILPFYKIVLVSEHEFFFTISERLTLCSLYFSKIPSDFLAFFLS